MNVCPPGVRAVAALTLVLALGIGAGPPPGPGKRALANVERIAALGPRPAGSAGEARAAVFVAARFRALGYSVSEQRIALPSGGRSRNVVARGGGRPRVLLVAHVDGVRGTVAANDNASGVATLIELARALAGRDGVVLVATGAEERVVTGSDLHLGAQRLLSGLSAAERRGIRLALSLDMVGVGTRLHVRGLEARPNRSARLALARGVATYLRDGGLSDHAELTRRGVPAAWLQWREDACWHSPCDRPARVGARQLALAYAVALRAARAALESP